MDKTSFLDCYVILNRATKSDIRVSCGSEGRARKLRHRIHIARDLNRKPEYEAITVSVRNDEGRWWVYLERFGDIEELEDQDVGVKGCSAGNN